MKLVIMHHDKSNIMKAEIFNVNVVPRVGEEISFNNQNYTVESVVFCYDVNTVYVRCYTYKYESTGPK
jgi:hypothetical protein